MKSSKISQAKSSYISKSQKIVEESKESDIEMTLPERSSRGRTITMKTPWSPQPRPSGINIDRHYSDTESEDKSDSDVCCVCNRQSPTLHRGSGIKIIY
jgi:hypothetical protein